MTFSPIESVVAAAERQAVIDWEREHREPQPCEHDDVVKIALLCGPSFTYCAACGATL